MSKKTDTQSIISKIQNQMEKRDLDRRFSKQIKHSNQNNKKYTTSFLNSQQIRNKSFDGMKSDHFESCISKKSNEEHHCWKDKQKLHESFSHLKEKNDETNNRSLHFTEFNNEQPKKVKNIKFSDYFQKCEQLMGRVSAPKQEKQKNISQNMINQFQQFKIQDISSLLQLIDTCVEEANSYISDLIIKIDRLVQQSEDLKRVNRRLQEMNKTHLVVIKEKDEQLSRLSKTKQPTRNQDLKNLLKIIDQANEQNELLKKQIQILKNQQPKIILSHTPTSNKKKQMYDQIHSKIDILNISISREQDKLPYQIPQVIKEVNQEQYLPKDTAQLAASASKKYKYIKPKSIGSITRQ